MICLFWLSCSLIYLYQSTLDNYATDFLYVSLHSRPVYQPRQHLQLLVLQQKEKNQPQHNSLGTSLFLHSAGQEKCQALEQGQPHQVPPVIHLTSHHLHFFLPVFPVLLVELLLLRFFRCRELYPTNLKDSQENSWVIYHVLYHSCLSLLSLHSQPQVNIHLFQAISRIDKSLL